MAIQQVYVVGAGLMGSGIAQVCAQAGIDVQLHDVDAAALDRALAGVRWSVEKLCQKGKLQEAADQVLARIARQERLDGVAEADLIVEAVNEDLELKRRVFSALGQRASATAVLASNTSALSITQLAAATPCPERVLGLHFFSPVPMMQAVEVVRGASTSDACFEAGLGFVRAIGKEPIAVQRDAPGFLINRINLPSSVEAMRLVEQGIGSVEDIDKGVKLALGRRMGIFETGDMVGLDVTHAALMALYQETGDPRWFPPTILRRKVAAGHLGRKAGRGWYRYAEDGTPLALGADSH